MRQLPWTGGRFDRVLNWSTAFGYFDDTANRAGLDGIARVLRPGGRLAMDLDNQTKFLTCFTPSRVVAARGDGDMLVDRYHLDAQTGRLEAERTVIRDGRTRRLNFVKRLFGFPELRDWLLAAGFTTVSGYGENARPLTADHKGWSWSRACPESWPTWRNRGAASPGPPGRPCGLAWHPGTGPGTLGAGCAVH